MLTLREFLDKVNAREHYRIYQPNRDCLIFESYFKVHSPYCFNNKADDERSWFNFDYYDNNDFCDDVRCTKEIDEETKILLDKYGDYEVFLLECSSFKPRRMFKDKSGAFHIDNIDEYPDYLNCFNVFIE